MTLTHNSLTVFLCLRFPHHPPQSDARVCGPWVGNDGELSTHTSSQIGSINKTFYDTLSVNFEGTNTLIAHIKIANIQIALGKELRVVPQKGTEQTPA